MVKASRRGALRRMLGNFWFGLGALAVPPASAASTPSTIDEDAESDENLAELLSVATDMVEPAVAGHRLAVVLDQLDPFEATHTAALAAQSDRVAVRLALAEALSWDFALVGADVILDHLSRDPEQPIRFAVARAAHARRATLDDAILLRLATDDDSLVANTAAFAMGARRG